MTMHVALTRRVFLDDTPGPPLLAPAGARVILGGATDELPAPITPAAHTLFGPRGAALAGPHGPLVVADTGHHRVLIWRRVPREDREPADLVIGQPHFAYEGRNAKGEPTAATCNVPTGVAISEDARAVAVADAWNHRVLIWYGIPREANQPADVVLGQPDGESCHPNRGRIVPGADTLNWCYGVAICNGKLIVADTGNRRVLIWDRLPERHGAPADLVLGQRAFTGRDDNGGLAPGPVGMRWPHSVAWWGGPTGNLMVADAGNNRIMGWRGMPRSDGQPCDYVLGQAGFAGTGHNRGEYYPTSASLNMPYGVAVLGDRLVVADTASSRLLGFMPAARMMGGAAAALSGQRTFGAKGDNRWAAPARDSMSWPYAITACGTTAVIADTGNNRILLWEVA